MSLDGRALEAPGNPLAPCAWEVEYAGGIRVPAWTGARWLRTSEIDRTRLVALHLLGLPCGPLRLPVGPGIPERVVVAATRTFTVGGGRAFSTWRRFTIGCVHGGRLHGARVDRLGVDVGVFRWSGH